MGDKTQHEAYEYMHLLKLTVQMESLASYDDPEDGLRLLVGTRQGHLLMYSVLSDRNTDPRSNEIHLLRFNKNFSKKPVQQLGVVREQDIIVKLSDNVVSVHELSTVNFSLLENINKTKGATFFSLDVKRPVTLSGTSGLTVRMAVVVKRKLQIYYLKNRKFYEMQELTMADVPKIIAWATDTICLGFKGSYALIQVSKGETQELFPTGKHLEPTITVVSNDSFALVKDSLTVFMNTKAEPTNVKFSVRWSNIPIALGYHEPYLIALLDECIEVRCWDIEADVRIQTLPIKAKLIDVSSRGIVFIASHEHIWLLRSVPAHKQIKILLHEKRFELALKLANISEDSEDDKRRNIYQIQTLYAFDLFDNKKFTEAMKEFQKLDTDPYEVIRLFPTLLPQSARDSNNPGPKFEDSELEKGLSALITYLIEVRTELNIKLESDSSEPKHAYQLMQIIDTTLLKCYLQTNDALAAPLLRRDYCNLDEAERTLKGYQKYPELVILYQTKGLHQKALELLKTQADQPDSELRGHEKTIQYLQNLGKEHIELIFEYAGWVLERVPDEGLKIFIEDTPEVEQLPRPKVLDYLLKTEIHSLVEPYLEHVVHVWKDTNIIFHNALVHEYLRRIKESSGEASAQHIKTKLLTFLEKSDHYSPESVLIHFPSDSLFEERAIVNGKLGRHEHALGIYVSLLGNHKKAIEYCDKIYTNGGGGGVYVQLLRLLISPPDTLPGISKTIMSATPDLETALTLLEGWGTRVPPIEALKEIPDSVPISRLSHFLKSSFRAQLNRRRKTELLKGLLYAEYLQTQEKRMQLEAIKFVMEKDNLCTVCKKRFGNQSAFIRFPNGNIVHFSCEQKMT